MNFGQTAQDKITGFRGVITGKCSYISGCSQILIVPVSKDNDYKEGRWFDEQRVKIDETLEAIVLDNGTTPGCDLPAPIR